MKCRKMKWICLVFCVFLYGSISANVSASEAGSASERMNLNLMKTVASVQKNKVVVAVIDTGVQTGLFPNRCVQGYNAMTGAADITDVQDTNGHGTEVASVIINNTPDNVKILPIKVGNGEDVGLSDSDEDGITEEAIQRAVDYACEPDADVDIINLCCGYDADDADTQTFLNTYIDKAVAKGIPVIVSAGNRAKVNGSYPACYAACWTVGAIQGDNTRADFSDYGDSLDFVAPGVGINVITNTGGSISKSGTSFSAPYLTAFAANLLGADSYGSVALLYNKIVSLCENLGSANEYGNGIPVYQCEHEKTNIVVKTEATCAENGISYCVCQYCGEIIRTITIGKKEHSWKKESTAPTIVSTGTSYELCTACGAVQNVISQKRLSSATAIKVSKRSSSSLTFSWKKVTGAEGYRIVCGSKAYEITGTKMTVKKLKAGTIYKIAVQPYTTYKGQKEYGNATSVKNVTACAKVTGIRKSKTKVKWKKISASGYEICYSKKKNFKSAKKLLVKTTSKKLKKGYYVKVRAYKVLNGKKIYGSYSKIIKV